MENENIIILQLRLTRKKALFFLTAFFISWRPGFLGSEQLTLTTYYPAPYGGYASLLTTGQTLLARDGGNVGVGTSVPGAKLDVAGQVKITGGSPGAGKVLTSDASGLASWQTSGGSLQCITTTAGYVYGGACAACPAGYTVTGGGISGACEGPDSWPSGNTHWCGKCSYGDDWATIFARCCK